MASAPFLLPQVPSDPSSPVYLWRRTLISFCLERNTRQTQLLLFFSLILTLPHLVISMCYLTNAVSASLLHFTIVTILSYTVAIRGAMCSVDSMPGAVPDASQALLPLILTSALFSKGISFIL